MYGRGGQMELGLHKLHSYTLDLANKVFVDELREEDQLHRSAASQAASGLGTSARGRPTRKGFTDMVAARSSWPKLPG